MTPDDSAANDAHHTVDDSWIYMFATAVWNPYEPKARSVFHAPLVAIRAKSPYDPAIEVLPIIDALPAQHIAARFRVGKPCQTVADEPGGELLNPKLVTSLIGVELPEERPDILALFGNLYAPPHDFAAKATVRRRANRG